MIEKLIDAGVHPTQARTFGDPLKAAMALYDISTATRQAAFVAQLMVESTRFTKLEEDLFYKTETAARDAFGARVMPHLGRLLRNPKAMANFAYANRNGNGDEASGDGWKYRGRGLIQLTGKDNYAAASYGCGLGMVLIHKPEAAADPSDACHIAAWYWQSRGCNQLIDAGDFHRTTRLINGAAMLHKHERAAAFHHTLAAFA
ncbi:MAG: glycoside hydrolase family 19 protein [Hydrogenophaga sp.]|uniref:glycoside hydrolase family 19 protein n=1 Tax=Hydrogenophaga sp. TaxID=1904254 RepID=UPI0040360116